MDIEADEGILGNDFTMRYALTVRTHDNQSHEAKNSDFVASLGFTRFLGTVL